MSPRLTEALERLLLERAAADGQRVKALEERVKELERELAQVVAVGSGSGNGGDVDGVVVEALREEFAQNIQRLERRVERLESTRGGGNAPGGAKAERARSQRRYPDVVTWQPADDDEPVYGAAWPLVDEWRGLWDSHPPTGKGLAWVSNAPENSGAGSGDAGGARLDAAPGDHAAAGPGPGRAIELAGAGVGGGPA